MQKKEKEKENDIRSATGDFLGASVFFSLRSCFEQKRGEEKNTPMRIYTISVLVLIGLMRERRYF